MLMSIQETTVMPSLAVSADSGVPAGPFARTCQATHLLSRVLRHIRDKNVEARFYFEEAMILHKTLSAFHEVLKVEVAAAEVATFDGHSERNSRRNLLTAAALCYSALVGLYDQHTCADAEVAERIGIPEQIEVQAIALPAILEIGVEIQKFAGRIMQLVEEEGLLQTSPFWCDCLYSAGMKYTWYIQETSNFELMHAVSDIKNALKTLARRWTIAGKVLVSLVF